MIGQGVINQRRPDPRRWPCICTIREMPSRFARTVVFTAALLGVGLVSLADRAPDATRGLLRLGLLVGQRIERVAGIDWFDRTDVPLAWDTAGHIGLWATLGFLGYLAARPEGRPFTIAFLLFVLSASVELGQAFFSSTRESEMLDLAANGLGITVGVIAAVLVSGLDQLRHSVDR